MDLAAGVGEHLQHVVFRLAAGGHVGHGEAAALRPGLLPARFGGAEIVARRFGGGRFGQDGIGHAAAAIRLLVRGRVLTAAKQVGKSAPQSGMIPP